jgi:hypothetical protein
VTATQRTVRVSIGLGLYIAWLIASLLLLWPFMTMADRSDDPLGHDVWLTSGVSALIFLMLIAQWVARRLNSQVAALLMHFTLLAWLGLTLYNSFS